jgi:hypothetical protein
MAEWFVVYYNNGYVNVANVISENIEQIVLYDLPKGIEISEIISITRI